jgi:hypothetical protein
MSAWGGQGRYIEDIPSLSWALHPLLIRSSPYDNISTYQCKLQDICVSCRDKRQMYNVQSYYALHRIVGLAARDSADARGSFYYFLTHITLKLTSFCSVWRGWV